MRLGTSFSILPGLTGCYDGLRMIPASSSRGQFGFSCQTCLAARLQKYLGGLYYVWFSRELNPIGNGDSSNPLRMYADMDMAVKRHDINNAKLKDLRVRLLNVVRSRISDKLLARQLRREIVLAQPEMFRPQLWRIDLATIAASRIKLDESRAGWDEQYIADLSETEFQIIVE